MLLSLAVEDALLLGEKRGGLGEGSSGEGGFGGGGGRVGECIVMVMGGFYYSPIISSTYQE